MNHARAPQSSGQRQQRAAAAKAAEDTAARLAEEAAAEDDADEQEHEGEGENEDEPVVRRPRVLNEPRKKAVHALLVRLLFIHVRNDKDREKPALGTLKIPTERTKKDVVPDRMEDLAGLVHRMRERVEELLTLLLVEGGESGSEAKRVHVVARRHTAVM